MQDNPIVNDASIVYQNIRQFRKNKNQKQSEVARALEVSQSYYSEIESGKHVITIEFLCSLANFYKVDIEEFFKGVATPH